MQCMSYANKYSNYDVNYDYNGHSMLLEAIRCYYRTTTLGETSYIAFKRLKAWMLLDMIQSLDISCGFGVYLVYLVTWQFKSIQLSE